MTEAEEHQAMLDAMRALMAPLARLLVARGVPYATAEESLKAALVEAARVAHSDGLPHRQVSRIATTTGINRREVTRLTRAGAGQAAPQRSIASEVFTHWRTAPAYLDARGQPIALARQGEAPSFEALARGVTQDVHPRSMLDELLRLGLATHDPESDTVTLVLADFVPSADRSRMLAMLADNVGDHFSAAVENVLGDGPRHLERAIFAHGMSPESVAAAEAWVARTWQQMLGDLVPFLEARIAEDDADPARAKDGRFRTGLYAFARREPAATAPNNATGPEAVRGKPKNKSTAARSANPESRSRGRS